MPLMQHIRNFEKRKRDEDPEIIVSVIGEGSINELKLEKGYGKFIKRGPSSKVI